MLLRSPQARGLVPCILSNITSRISGSLVRPSKLFSRAMTSSSSDQSGLNRLTNEKSPYLLQHASNPVDWYPWGNEAFEKAKSENKVIFLSVGYSTCHWCHVMERESFESAIIAKIMNEHFVNIKVDREERPDVDRVYMTYVQASTGSGGWPMSVWLTPDLKPIVGGTYFPPDDRYYGRPGFASVLKHVAEQWRKSPAKVVEQGSRILSLLEESVVLKSSEVLPSEDVVHTCFDQLAQGYDKRMGGFSKAPKFPQPVTFNFLLRYYSLNRESEKGKSALEMVLHTLRMMAKGGIHDHVSKGFHRYSTDGLWHVPHFEKMLYDQAQLTVSYLDAFQITGDPFFADVARDILEYVKRDLCHQSGGCYSAEDADSLPTFSSVEKKEGAFCVWTWNEVHNLLRESVTSAPTVTMADVFCKHFKVKEGGNVDPLQDPHDELKGKNVLMESSSVQETADHFGISLAECLEVLQKSKDILHTARLQKPRPHLDDKIIAAWNGLMLSAFARAAQVLKDESFLESAQNLAQFLNQNMYNKDKRQLIRSVYRGKENTIEIMQHPIPAILDDYCCVIRGLLDVYEVTYDLRWLEWALELQETQEELFWDSDGSGGYFSSLQDDHHVVLRIKADQDGAEPSGNSIAVSNLVRLGSFFPESEWKNQAKKLLEVFEEQMRRAPLAFPEMVAGYMYFSSPCQQVIIKGERCDPAMKGILDCIHEQFLPFKVVLLADNQIQGSKLMTQMAVLKDILQFQEPISVHVCKGNVCLPPVTTTEKLRKLLEANKVSK